MSYQNKKRKTKPEVQKYPLGLLLPIIALLAVIPLITFMHTYSTGLDQYEWYTSVTDTVDFFLYYKMIWIIAACICMLFCMIYLFFSAEEKAIWIKNLIPLAVYCGISLISAFASINRYYSFHGIYEQFEPVWVLIGYGIMVYYTFFIMRSMAAVQRTMRWFMGGVTVMSALGLSQVFYHDFFRTTTGQKLMTPSSYDGGALEFNFELGRPYLSLYNPNYVGFYVAMIVPVVVALIFAAKKLWHRIAYAALIISLLLILFASQSRAGIVALGFSLLVMILCMRKLILKNWIITGSAIAVIVVAFFGVNAMNHNVLINRLKEMFVITEEYHALQSIETTGKNVIVTYNGETLSIDVNQDSAGNDQFILTDGDGNTVESTVMEDGATMTITDPRFPFTYVSSRADNFNGFILTIDGNPWYLTNLMKAGDNSFYCLAGAGALVKLTNQNTSVTWLEKHYSFANNRGYIWVRTIPLLKKYFLLGSGPDTFIIAFPNNDLVGMFVSGHANEIMTKPHCMYLQVGVQTGVISLLALMVFFIWYLVDSLRIFWKNTYQDYMSLIGVGIFTGVIGYLILALTNDSCVALSPIFYVLIGMGLGINYKVKQDRKLASKPAKNITKSAAKKDTTFPATSAVKKGK